MKDVKPIFKDHTGRWRESNPHDEWQGVYEHGRYIANEKNPEHKKFEQSLQYHDFPNPPEVKPGEVVMAYLRWQFKCQMGVNEGKWLNGEKDDIEYLKGEGFEIKAIWILASSPEASQGNDARGKEYILCAAIHFNDNIEHEHQPVNIFDGFVVSGRRHHDCYATLSAIAKSINLDSRIRLLIDKTDRDRQGFITNFNRFVDRKEGYQIAKSAGQLLRDMHDKSNPILISEDLY